MWAPINAAVRAGSGRSLKGGDGVGHPSGVLKSCLKGAPAPKPRRAVTFSDVVETRAAHSYKGRKRLCVQKLEAGRCACRYVVKDGSLSKRSSLDPQQEGYLMGDAVRCRNFIISREGSREKTTCKGL